MWKPAARHGTWFLVYRVWIGVTILWMAVFYPAVCEYHGLMLFKPPMSSAVSRRIAADLYAHRDSMAMTGPEHGAIVEVPSRPNLATLVPTLQHQTYPITMTMISLLAISIDALTFVKLFPHPTLRILATLLLDHQHYPIPPTRPPRLSPV
jgi:hypothetical protein